MSKWKFALLGALLVPTAAQAGFEEQLDLTQAKVLVAGKYTTSPALKNILQEAVNCIAGPGGKGYDAARPNPCSGVGNGLIPDAKAGDKARYEDALVRLTAVMAEPDNTARMRGLRAVSAVLAGNPIPAERPAGPAAPARPPTAAEIAAGVRAAPEPSATLPPTPVRN